MDVANSQDAATEASKTQSVTETRICIRCMQHKPVTLFAKPGRKELLKTCSECLVSHAHNCKREKDGADHIYAGQKALTRKSVDSRNPSPSELHCSRWGYGRLQRTPAGPAHIQEAAPSKAKAEGRAQRDLRV